jgi:hypothetical protein
MLSYFGETRKECAEVFRGTRKKKSAGLMTRREIEV